MYMYNTDTYKVIKPPLVFVELEMAERRLEHGDIDIIDKGDGDFTL